MRARASSTTGSSTLWTASWRCTGIPAPTSPRRTAGGTCRWSASPRRARSRRSVCRPRPFPSPRCSRSRHGRRWRSERPALPPLVELHLLEALAPAGRAEAEVELAHVVVAAQLGGRTVEDDPAVLHDVAVIRDAQGHLGVLLDEQERRPPLLVNLTNDVEDLAHQERREPERRLV